MVETEPGWWGERRNRLGLLHEDLSLIPRTHVEISDLTVYTCNPSAGEMETG